jgi:CubicO group peptidase (beta-lactamase class C family)
MKEAIDRALNDAIATGIFPSADLLVAKGGKVLHSAQYGEARHHTCFDIASLTKPLASATISMMLVAEKILRLDDTVYQWLGGARQPIHKQMTIRHLLNHTSGLPAWQPFYLNLPISLIGTEAGRELILDECHNEPVVANPDEKTIYSDIGYIILGEILDQVGGAPLDALFAQYVARPLGLIDTFFVRTVGAPIRTSSRRTTTTADKHVPTPKGAKVKERQKPKEHAHRRFAPTEDCPWRERVIHGEVHDQNAYALGGVAGHAGLFSTTADIHRFICELVDCWHGRSNWLPQNIVRELIQETKSKTQQDIYVMGWNRPLMRSSSSGHHFSPNSIGHLAYTGCSIWIDLSHDFWIILLTNRIHPSSTNQKIKAFRPKIHDLIYQELIAGR